MTLQTTLAIIVKKKKRSSSIRVSKWRGAKNEYRKISPEKSRVLEDSTWFECPRITGQSGGRSAGIEHRYTIDDAALHPRTSRFFRSRALEMKKSFRTSNTRHNDDPRSFRSKQPWFPSMLVLAPRIKKNFDKTDEENGNGKKKKYSGNEKSSIRRMKRIRLERYSSCTTLKAFQFSTDAFFFFISPFLEDESFLTKGRCIIKKFIFQLLFNEPLWRYKTFFPVQSRSND